MKIFLDVTQTVMFAANTGIQRVVTRFASHTDIVSPIAWIGSRYVRVVCRPATFGHQLRRVLGKFIKKILLLYTNRAKRDERIVTEGISNTSSVDWFTVARRIGYFFLSLPYVFRRTVSIQRGDAVVFAEITTAGSVAPRIAFVKNRGAHVVAFIHDMFIFTHPSYFTARDVTILEPYYRLLLKEAEMIVVISEFTKQAVLSFLKEQMPDRVSVPIVVSHNGVDPLSEIKPVSSRIQILSSNTDPLCLVVGTIEPRKNHTFILSAFELVWKQNPSARLVCVGAKGWLHNEVLSLVHAHPRYGTSLFLIHDAHDAELAVLYRRANMLIAASVAEGFDLPTVEALLYGCPVIASDIPVHREVLGNRAFFFSLDSVSALADKVKQVLLEKKQSPIAVRTSREQLVDIVDAIKRTVFLV